MIYTTEHLQAPADKAAYQKAIELGIELGDDATVAAAKERLAMYR